MPMSEEEIQRIQAENQEYKRLFDKQHERVAIADKFWQIAHNKPDVLPDLGELVEYLLNELATQGDRIDRAGSRLHEMTDLLFRTDREREAFRTENARLRILQRSEKEIIVGALRRQLGAHAIDQPDGSIKVGWNDINQDESLRSYWVVFVFEDQRLKMVERHAASTV